METETLARKRILVLEMNTPAYEAARAMNERSIGSALVSDGRGRIAGIVTDRDLACGILGERLSPDTPISEVMAPKPKGVTESAKLTKVLQIMQRYGVRRVPVFAETKSHRQKCVGIYTLDDLIISGHFSLKDLKPVIKKQIRPQAARGLRNERRESKKENTLNRFNKAMGNALKLDEDTSEPLVHFLLKSIIERVTAPLAANFIAELPSLLQEDFLSGRAGPNRANSLEYILQNMEKRFGILEREAMKLLPRFWGGIEKFMKSGVTDHVLAGLPADLRRGFSPKGPRLRLAPDTENKRASILTKIG